MHSNGDGDTKTTRGLWKRFRARRGERRENETREREGGAGEEEGEKRERRANQGKRCYESTAVRPDCAGTSCADPLLTVCVFNPLQNRSLARLPFPLGRDLSSTLSHPHSEFFVVCFVENYFKVTTELTVRKRLTRIHCQYTGCTSPSIQSSRAGIQRGTCACS